ncbi:hypothetical protein TruAng_012267 [Truncatella angustata]|nr:hypothetical protein TruAng_012267 [Truncatella angustata]
MRSTKYRLPFTCAKCHLIPPKIWQILLPHPDNPATSSLDAKNLVDTPSWLVQNPGYGYILLGQKEADNFVNVHFSADADPAVKSDLLRYLMFFIEGGVYTDGCDWYRMGPARRWNMGRDTINILESLAAKRMTTLNTLDLSSVEVMMSSGPASWTDVVLEQLNEMDLNVTGVADFSGMKPTGPRLYGDILILTIDGFGMGQLHSNSTHDGTTPEAALLKHKFRGSWGSSV